MKTQTHTDALGRELKVKFGVGGFNDDITYCDLFRKVKITPKLFGMKSKYVWKKVYSGITTDSLADVSNWTVGQFHLLALKAIDEYNWKKVNTEKVKNMTQKLNQI